MTTTGLDGEALERLADLVREYDTWAVRLREAGQERDKVRNAIVGLLKSAGTQRTEVAGYSVELAVNFVKSIDVDEAFYKLPRDMFDGLLRTRPVERLRVSLARAGHDDNRWTAIKFQSSES